MAEMEEVFFSFTMGGEAVSLAAAKAVLDKLEREPVIETLRIRGAEVQAEVERLLSAGGAGEFIAVSGDPTWSFLNFTPPEGVDVWALKTLFLQEVFARGLFTLGTHNMSYAHGDEEVSALVEVYAEVLNIMDSRDKDITYWYESYIPKFDKAPVEGTLSRVVEPRTIRIGAKYQF